MALLGCTQPPPDTPLPPTTDQSLIATPTTAPEPTPTPTPTAQATPTHTISPPTPRPATATPLPEPTPTPDATATPEPFQEEHFLQLVNPPEAEVFVSEPAIEIIARTRVDAVVTVNDTLVEPDIDGNFSLGVNLEEGPNIIEVVSSVASGDEESLVLVVFYLP